MNNKRKPENAMYVLIRDYGMTATELFNAVKGGTAPEDHAALKARIVKIAKAVAAQ